MKLNTIVRHLNKEIDIKTITDYSCNGLQYKAKDEVKKIGFAVDGSLSTFIRAKKLGVDLLIVHHGFKWKPQKYPLVYRKRRDYLKKNNFSLYGVHLPLDAHHKLGNNIGLAKMLELQKIKPFGSEGEFKIGFKGELKKSKEIAKIAKKLLYKLGRISPVKVYNFGKNKIKSIGIVSGGGADCIEDAVKEKLDCFIVGEIDLGSYNRAKDYGLNLIVAGHYATETVGVKLLQKYVKDKWPELKTVFIDNPIGI